MKSKGKKRIFYGWWIILVAGVGLFLSYISVVSFTFGVFINSLGREFNWSRGQISLAFSLSLMAMCAAMPLIGRLVDRLGARKVILPSVLAFGLCLISLYFLSTSLWHFYAIYLIMGIVGGGSGQIPYSRVISQWFDRRRGLALGLAMVGAGLGSFIMPYAAHELISNAGWRAAYLYMGFVVIMVTIPVVALALKEKPETMGLLPDGQVLRDDSIAEQSRAEFGMSCREALRSGIFWLMCFAFFLVAMSVIGCLIHLAPMLTDRGVSPGSAAFAASLLGGSLILGRVGAGYLLDRFFASYVAVCFFCGAALGVLLLWAGAAGSLAFAAALLLGLGLGAEGDIMAYLVSRYFGLRAFGEIYSYAMISFTLGGVVGPLFMGLGFDATGSYRLVLGAFLMAALTAAALMTRLGPYRSWEIARPSPAPDEALEFEN